MKHQHLKIEYKYCQQNKVYQLLFNIIIYEQCFLNLKFYFHFIIIIFNTDFKINIKIHQNEIQIVDIQEKLFDNIKQQIQELEDNQYISLWPDQFGRQIIDLIISQNDKRINIVLQGTYNKLDKQILNNFIKGNKNINIIQFEDFQKLNQNIQISFVIPRVNQLSCGLIVNQGEKCVYSSQSLDEELEINYGNEQYDKQNNQQIIKTISIQQFVQKSNKIIVLFKGSHMKESAKLIVEEQKGIVFQIIKQQMQLEQKQHKIKILMDFESSKLLKQIQYPWLQNDFQWNQKTNYSAIKQCFCQICLQRNKYIENITYEDFIKFISETYDEEINSQQVKDQNYKQNVLNINETQFKLIKDFIKSYNFINYQDIKQYINQIKQCKKFCWQFLCGSNEIYNQCQQHNNQEIQPENNKQKRNINVCFFSPHPDDDVVSAGGIQSQIIKQTLNNEYNDVNITLHMCYCVTGAVAVSDQSLIQFMNRFNQNENDYEISDDILQNVQIYNNVNYITKYICSQEEFQQLFQFKISPKSKALLRELETMAALDTFDFFKNQNNTANFLRLPFYGSGFGQRKTPGQEDINIVTKILQQYQPDIILLAGDLNDPHGTHSRCYEIIKQACKIYEQKYRILQPLQHTIYKSIFNFDYINISLDEIKDLILNKNVLIKFLYRGAWDDFLPNEATFIYLMDKQIMNKKIISANQHESQMGQALYLANDKRSFDVRVIQRNYYTAQFLKNIGLIDTKQKIYAECLVACEQLP